MIINLKLSSSNIFERTDCLQRYYADVKKYKILSIEEENLLFLKVKNGNKEEKQAAKNAIINANQRFVIAVAKRFASNNNLLDLIAEGNLGLIEAIDSYSLDKETRFTSWAIWYIRRSINQYCVNYGSLVRKSNLSKTYHTISQAKNKFLQKEGRQPTDDELIEILNDEFNLNLKSLRDVIDTNVISIDDKVGEHDDDREIGEVNAFNSVCASINTYENVANDDYNHFIIQKTLNKLKTRDKEVISMLFGIGYDRPYEIQEVAKKMNMTSERIRQLKGEILLKLKGIMEVSYK